MIDIMLMLLLLKCRISLLRIVLNINLTIIMILTFILFFVAKKSTHTHTRTQSPKIKAIHFYLVDLYVWLFVTIVMVTMVENKIKSTAPNKSPYKYICLYIMHVLLNLTSFIRSFPFSSISHRFFFIFPFSHVMCRGSLVQTGSKIIVSIVKWNATIFTIAPYINIEWQQQRMKTIHLHSVLL